MIQQEQWQLCGSQPAFYERCNASRQLRTLALLLLERVQPRPGQRVLDVACGVGIVARLAAPLVAPSGRVVGLDLDESTLAIARAYALEARDLIEWKQGNAAELPFADATFDAVLCQQGLQSFPDKPAALREMHRVLVPHGVLALSVFGAPNRYDAALAEAIARYVNEKIAKRSLAPFTLGDVDALYTIVNGAGFAHAEICTSVITQRVQPSQEWLLHDSAGSPYASSIVALDAATRAAMVREIGAKLKEFWDRDSFAVPTDVHLVYAQK